ncbi:MAG: SDR family NAD(P)-dependent oxidoreductase [Myxococcota bacterium]
MPNYTTALVTGASAGIGREVARKLAAEGLHVAFCARREERLQTLADAIEAAGGEALPIVCDLRDEAQIDTMFQQAEDELGHIDVLVNNAGMGRNTPLIGGDPEKWRAMWEVNVHALTVCTSKAAEGMVERDRGHVIHIGSMSGHRVPNGSGMYSATKYAVRSLTEGLRMELRSHESRVRATCISPGFVETEFAEKYSGDPDRAEEVYEQVKAIQPDDIADAVWFVLSAPGNVQYHDLLLRPTHQQS